MQNLTKWFLMNLFFFVTAHVRVTNFNRAVQVAIGHSQTNPERDVNLHTLELEDGCCT